MKCQMRYHICISSNKMDLKAFNYEETSSTAKGHQYPMTSERK